MLSALVDDTRTDKNTVHSYLDLYQELLSSRKNSAKSVLEVGIHLGGSIKLWYDFFPNATIHALDILHLNEIADDLKKYGGYIPGIRPGQATSDYLHHTMSRITLAGALFLCVIAIIPNLMTRSFGINYYVSQFFGGTSLLITVGVVLDTMRMMESHLMMRHYDGFLSGVKASKPTRLRGRI